MSVYVHVCLNVYIIIIITINEYPEAGQRPLFLVSLFLVSGSDFRQDGSFNAVLLQIVCHGHKSD